MSSFDIQAEIEPIGMLPEKAYGVPLTGFEVAAAAGIGVDVIEITPDLPTYNTTHPVGDDDYTVDEDYFKFLRIQIVRQVGGVTSKHIIIDMPNPDEIKIEPPLATAITIGDDINLIPSTIQGRIVRAPNELEMGRTAEGGVGDGLYKEHPIEAARMGKITFDTQAGSDFFKYGDNVYAYSSLKAFVMTYDGKIPNDMSGDLNIRERPNSSTIKSFSLCYRMRQSPNQIRLLTGCIATQTSISFDDDMSSHLSENHEVLYGYMLRTLPDKTIPPDLPYKRYLLRSHGHCTSVFTHGTVLGLPAGPTDTLLTVGSVTGYEDGDDIIITSKIDGYQFPTTITTVDVTAKTFLVSPALPAARNWTEGDVIEQDPSTSAKRVKIRKLDITLNNQGEIFGHIGSGKTGPTQGVANGSDYNGSITLDRESNQVSFDMQYDQNDLLWWKHKLQLAYNSNILADFTLEYEAFNTSNLTEELKVEMERMVDAFGFQIKNITEAKIAKSLP